MAGRERGDRGSTRDRAHPNDEGAWSRRYLAFGVADVVLVVLLPDPARGWFLLLGALGLAGCAAVASRRQPGWASPATGLLVGAVLLVPAYALWYPLTQRWDLQFSSPAVTDLLFLVAYACFVLAMARLIGQRSGGDRRLDVLDTLIVGVGLGVLLWVTSIEPYLHDGSMSWPARLTAISYTVVDLLLVGAIVRILVQSGITTVGDRLLGGWVLSQLAADLSYATSTLDGRFALGDPLVAMYPLSFALLGAALLHPTTLAPRRAVDPVRSLAGPRRLFLMVPAALVAPAVITGLAIRAGEDDIVTVAVLSAVLFSLVLGRVWFLAVDVEDHRRTRARLTESIELERQRAEENQVLLASLSERQMLSDRLSRIQRKISTRAPLQEVLDAITQGAAELVHVDVAALRFVDEDDPDFMVMASSVGVEPDAIEGLRRLPVGSGVGGRAIVTNRLCIQDAYPQWDNAIGHFATSGLQTAMAVPVHLGTDPIGSLVVATHRADRRYSQAEQDALRSFAEHVSIALNDARSVRAMNNALEDAIHQAMHDELTGLPNRACFYDRAEQALKRHRRDGGATAVLLLDLDRFKEINDTLGHRYGDQVLEAVGPRITPLLRETDTLARLGGDEFCVLLPDVSGLEDAVDVGDRITDALETPFEIDGMTLVVEASCGVAVAPDHGDTADLLLQRADIAMYAAKRSHASVIAYETRLDRNTPERLALHAELRKAIAEDELVLHFQPSIAVATGEVEGVEALVRWQHPRQGLLGPEVFVPIAEDTGLIHQLTSWVLDAALDQLRRWVWDRDVPVGRDFLVAVNLSVHSLLDESLSSEVGVALDRFGVAAEQLVLEITETTLMVDPDRAQRVLDQLARRGVHFAIDDFGTGYSSLASLKGLPVQHLKIDKSFVRCMHEDSDDAVIVRSVVELGHTLGLRTIAEGVEHPDALRRLAELGCDSAQGFEVAPPMPADEFVRWLRVWSPITAVAG